MGFHIVTDSNADLSAADRESFSDFSYLHVPYFINDVEGDPGITGHEFFEAMRNGASTHTAQINPPTFIALYEELIAEGKREFLCITLSSKLSGLCESATNAANLIMKKHPDVTILVVDTISASIGMGHLVKSAVEARDQGKSLSETRDLLEARKHRICHWFTVGDLTYLKRSGRLSAGAAWFGMALNIKPVLHIDSSGKLVPVEKKIGRAKAIQRLIDHYSETALNREKGIVYVLHADIPEEANSVKTAIEAQTGTKNVILTEMGPVIGSHVGPGTLAVIFSGTER